jgi:fructosamine-3-kinase
MALAHPLRDPAVVAEIERAASQHLGRRWVSQGLTDLAERSSHPCAILHGQPFSVFAKLGRNARDQFEAELDGLRLLTQSAGILIPVPIATGLVDLADASLLLFEALPERLPVRRTDRDWAEIGRALATLHQITNPRFGLTRQGFFGPLPQDNRPVTSNRCTDFFAQRRILPLLRTAVDSGNLPADLARGVARIAERLLAERLPVLVGPEPRPSLMHGDAQQNNFISTARGAVVIDASPYFGHPEIDLAQVDFFRPVPAGLFDAYRETAPIDKGFADRRDLWRLPTHLAIVAVDGSPSHIALLADAIRRYVSI